MVGEQIRTGSYQRSEVLPWCTTTFIFERISFFVVLVGAATISRARRIYAFIVFKPVSSTRRATTACDCNAERFERFSPSQSANICKSRRVLQKYSQLTQNMISFHWWDNLGNIDIFSLFPKKETWKKILTFFRYFLKKRLEKRTAIFLKNSAM